MARTMRCARIQTGKMGPQRMNRERMIRHRQALMLDFVTRVADLARAADEIQETFKMLEMYGEEMEFVVDTDDVELLNEQKTGFSDCAQKLQDLHQRLEAFQQRLDQCRVV
jgi:hypothetical protein